MLLTMSEAHSPKNSIKISNGNESVHLKKVHTRLGERLEISNPESGSLIRLDPLELESLTWQTSESLESVIESLEDFKPESDSGLIIENITEKEGEEMEISNEFAQVFVTKIQTSDRDGLEIKSKKLDFEIYLALRALIAITSADHDQFSNLLSTPFGPEIH
jgi:hypothetical protein